jgi:hypothetical protein
MERRGLFSSPWFSIGVTIVAFFMFIRYLVPALNADDIQSSMIELVIWLAMAVVFFVRFLLQLKSK